MSKQLSPGWTAGQVKDIAVVNPSGCTVATGDHVLVSFLPMAAVTELTGHIDLSIKKPFGEVKKGFTRFKDGDVLFAKITPSMENGKVAVARDLEGGLGCGTTEFHVIRAERGVEPDYLRYYFVRSAYRQEARRNMQGAVGQQRVPPDFIRDSDIPIAPIGEQKRIVSRIDELFSRIDEGERALERVRRLVERYRQAVLKAAVTGELTREWREKNKDKDKLETGEVLLARILKARREAWEKAELEKMKAKGITPANAKWKQKYEDPSPPDTTDLPELPKGWTYAAIDQLLAADKDAMKTGPFGSLLQKSEHVATGVPVLGIENVKARRFVPGSNIHVTAEKASELIGYRVVGGDIVISRSGTVGEVCVVPDGLGDARISTNLMKVSLAVGALVPDLLACQLYGSPVVLRTIDRLCKGSTRNFLNQTILRALPLVVPPLDEQEAILDALRVAEQNIDALDASLELELRRAAVARQSVLSAAFAGRLVSQDPADEPASTLLERIAAARGTDTAAPKRGRKSPLSPDPSPARGEG